MLLWLSQASCISLAWEDGLAGDTVVREEGVHSLAAQAGLQYGLASLQTRATQQGVCRRQHMHVC